MQVLFLKNQDEFAEQTNRGKALVFGDIYNISSFADNILQVILIGGYSLNAPGSI